MLGRTLQSNHIAVNIVVEIAILVEESIEERLLGKFGCLEELLLIFLLACQLAQRGTEAKGIIPQGIKLDDVSRYGEADRNAPLAVEFIHVTALSFPSV